MLRPAIVRGAGGGSDLMTTAVHDLSTHTPLPLLPPPLPPPLRLPRFFPVNIAVGADSSVINIHTSDRSCTDHVHIIYMPSTYHVPGEDRVQIMCRSSTYHVQIRYRSSTYHLHIIYRVCTYHLLTRSSKNHLQIIDITCTNKSTDHLQTIRT